MVKQKSLIEKEIEDVIKDENLWKGKCVKQMFNLKLQKVLEEAEKRFDELEFKIKTKSSGEEEQFISEKDTKHILNECFGVEKC